MRNYIGETKLEISDSEYKDYTQKDWALLWIEMYGGIDGSHHETWVLDQVVRILNGTQIKLKLAKWDDGLEEVRFDLDEPTQEYDDWVTQVKDGEDGPDTYGYDTGCAP